VVIAFVNVTSLTEAEARQQVLISELQHRTRNLLAVVQSIALQTLGRSDEVDAFSDRLAALGRLQGIVGMTAQGEVNLQEIVQLEIDAIDVKGENKITISGPSVPLRLEAAQAFALALHELATNALKYGALKLEAGQLDIAWRIEGRGHQRRLILNWNESGLPHPPETTRYGYGRELIEKALTFTLKARTQLRFEADGVRCRIEVPLELPPTVGQQRKEA
jgi:two-component system CheB/CheR fusion protein